MVNQDMFQHRRTILLLNAMWDWEDTHPVWEKNPVFSSFLERP